jgi:ABC-type transport system involved in cytochrome bd biosynthesis fused ATPase/permease subunit
VYLCRALAQGGLILLD